MMSKTADSWVFNSKSSFVVTLSLIGFRLMCSSVTEWSSSRSQYSLRLAVSRLRNTWL